jgi:hypothetical protein
MVWCSAILLWTFGVESVGEIRIQLKRPKALLQIEQGNTKKQKFL